MLALHAFPKRDRPLLPGPEIARRLEPEVVDADVVHDFAREVLHAEEAKIGRVAVQRVAAVGGDDGVDVETDLTRARNRPNRVATPVGAVFDHRVTGVPLSSTQEIISASTSERSGPKSAPPVSSDGMTSDACPQSRPRR